MTSAVKKAGPPSRRILRLLVGLAAVAALLAFVGYRLTLNPSVGTGPTPIPVPRDAWTKPWTNAPVLLVGIGDSITAGFGASPAHSYFDRLVANPEDEFDDMKGICLGAVFPALETKNLSVSGSTSIDHDDRQIEKLGKAGPNVRGLIVMTTGGNDIIHNYGRGAPREGAMYGATFEEARPWIENFRERLDSMIQAILGRFPGGCEIFLANIYDPTDGVGDIETAGLPPWKDGLAVLEAYNGVIAKAAEDHPNVHRVDLHSAFLGHGIHSAQFWRDHYRPDDPHYWYFTNLEDPNDRGYDAIRRLFLLKIAEVLAPRP